MGYKWWQWVLLSLPTLICMGLLITIAVLGGNLVKAVLG